MVIQYSENSLKYVKVIFMRSFNKKVTESQLDICHQVSLLEQGPCLHSVQFLPMQSHGNLPTTHTSAKTMGCSSQSECRNPLPRATPVQLIEHGDVKLEFRWNLHPYILVPLVQKNTLWATKRGTYTPLSIKTFDLQCVLPSRYVRAIVEQNLWEQITDMT